jgi:hypothetical protein
VRTEGFGDIIEIKCICLFKLQVIVIRHLKDSVAQTGIRAA